MSNLRDEFKVKYVGGILSRIHFWWTIRTLRRKKLELFWEAYMDKIMLETQYADDLAYNETEDRKTLVALRQAPGNKVDMEKVLTIEQKIARSKSVREIYKKTEEILYEQEQYIKMIDLWQSQTEGTSEAEKSLSE